MAKSIATAESITGGDVAALMTGVSGSSEYVAGGLVCYKEEVKVNVLGVDPRTIVQGYDIRELATELVLGCHKMFSTDVCVSTTGYIDRSFAMAVLTDGRVHTFVVKIMPDTLALPRVERKRNIARYVLQKVLEVIEDGPLKDFLSKVV